jgi:hypothetical protein
MNKDLQNAIHRYAEDREIDYFSAQYLGKALGMKFGSQQDLIEWKQTIDRYLKTFTETDFAAIEEMCNKKKKKTMKEANNPEYDEDDEDEYEPMRKRVRSGKQDKKREKADKKGEYARKRSMKRGESW